VTAWGMRRELVELCGGRHDGHQYRVEDLPDVVGMADAVPPGVSIADAWTLAYRRTDVVREADGAWLYVLDGIPWRGFEAKPTE
jgi:hypothetical protein